MYFACNSNKFESKIFGKGSENMIGAMNALVYGLWNFIKKMIIKIFNSTCIIIKRWKCLDFSWSTSHVNKTTETEIYITLHCNWWGWSITLI